MNIRPTARVVLLNAENKVLLLNTNVDNKSFWLTPGGKMEDNESAFETAKRELFEETGITNAQFLDDSHTWYYERIGRCNGEQTFFKEHIFVARIEDAHVHFDNLMDYEKDEISGFVWWDIAEFIEKKEVIYPETLAEDILVFIQQNVGGNKERSKEI